MAAIISVDALEAFDGDAILVTCRGDIDFHMLVDGGRIATAPVLRERLIALGHLDLLVVTHIDGDHIEGIVELLEGGAPVPIGEIWFNGLTHIAGDVVSPAFRDLAPRDGVRLTAAIKRSGIPWNAAFDGAAVCVKQAGDVVEKRFGEVKLSVVSPDRRRLRALGQSKRGWHQTTQEDQDEELGGPFRSLGTQARPDVRALSAQPDQNDTSGPNGSSIAFLVSFRGRRVLLCADAHPRLLAAGLIGLGAHPDAPLYIDVLKVSHHGSRANTTREFLALVDCGTFLLSGPGPNRPHDEAIAKIVSRDRQVDLVFNSHCECLARWNDEELKAKHGYSADVIAPGGILLMETTPSG